ncbi:hypothetical protein, partial [Vibrio parahaemolyticus]
KEIFKKFKGDLSEEQLELFNSLDPIIYAEDSDDLVIGKTIIRMGSALGRKTEEELFSNKLSFKKALPESTLTIYERDIEPYLDHNNNLLDT